MRMFTQAACALLAGGVFASAASAQAWPAKPVRVVVAFTAGGTTDILARSIGQQLSEKLKQPFVIDNKPGAGGDLGTELVVRSAPDGYTLMVNSVGPIAVNPTLYPKLPYNPLAELVPVVLIADVITTLNKAVNEIIGVPTMDAQLVKEGADPAGGTPEQFAQFVQREYEKWRLVVRESGATAE